MPWIVLLAPEFEREFLRLDRPVRVELAAHAALLEQFGPQLGRPSVDTLHGSKHSNLKELRFRLAGGVWRVAFAFDPLRRAVLLVARDKRGRSESRFYRELIRRADVRFDGHLRSLAEETNQP